jgi:Spy/CpxP family protein refolding chaperone
MKTSIRSTLFAVAIAATATVAATAGAQSTAPVAGQRIVRVKGDSSHWNGRRERGERGEGREMLRGVKPTDAQKAQIKAIHAKYKPQFESFRAATKPAMEEAKAARQRGDTAAARAAFDKTAGTRQQAMALRNQETAEIRAILTPAQQQTFDANVAKEKAHGDRMREGKGKRRAS